MLLKTHVEIMSLFGLSTMLLKTNELYVSLHDVDENKRESVRAKYAKQNLTWGAQATWRDRAKGMTEKSSGAIAKSSMDRKYQLDVTDRPVGQSVASGGVAGGQQPIPGD
jgi:hypothetical protein